MEQQHSDLGACFGLICPAAGCECIHLTLSACSLYRYSVDIRILHGHVCTCNGTKQIKIKCACCRCNHAIHMVDPVAQRYHVTSDTLGREFDPGKRDFSH